VKMCFSGSKYSKLWSWSHNSMDKVNHPLQFGFLADDSIRMRNGPIEGHISH